MPLAERFSRLPEMSFPCKRESSNFNPFWILAGVYPVAERGRNDELIDFMDRL
jgi:hypothetical protein